MKNNFKFYNINQDKVISYKKMKIKTLISVKYVLLKVEQNEFLYKIEYIVGNIVFVKDTDYYSFKNDLKENK